MASFFGYVLYELTGMTGLGPPTEEIRALVMSCRIVAKKGGMGEAMKESNTNRLAIFRAKDGQFPKQAISLLEIMRDFNAMNTCFWHSHLSTWIDETTKPRGAVLPLVTPNAQT